MFITVWNHCHWTKDGMHWLQYGTTHVTCQTRELTESSRQSFDLFSHALNFIEVLPVLEWRSVSLISGKWRSVLNGECILTLSNNSSCSLTEVSWLDIYIGLWQYCHLFCCLFWLTGLNISLSWFCFSLLRSIF